MNNRTVAAALAGLLLCGHAAPAGAAEDQIDRLLASGRVPRDMIRDHAYSDFTDPLGKYLDFLAAGAFAQARGLQPEACEAWRATREDSAWTGKFIVWQTEINLDTLCAPR